MSETMVERCPRFGKWIGGCRFEARYDEQPGANTTLEGFIPTMATKAILAAARKRTYVADVCIRCGKSVRREQPEGASS